MLEPKKLGDGGGLEPTDPAQQQDQTKQVDSRDMKIPDDGDGEPQPPAA